MKTPLKKFLLVLVLGAFMTTGFIACGDSDSGTDSGDNVPRDSDTPYYNSDTPSDKPSTLALDFFTTPCAQMGGKLNASGACYIPCNTDSDCAGISGASKCSRSGTWSVGYCEPETCYNQQGWHINLIDECRLTCFADNDTENCLGGTRCVEGTGRNDPYFCTGYIPGTSTGGGSGVCSGCGGLFCSGRCVGCPGC